MAPVRRFREYVVYEAAAAAKRGADVIPTYNISLTRIHVEGHYSYCNDPNMCPGVRPYLLLQARKC